MESSQPASGALLDRAGADVAQLLRRFESIVALAPVENRDRNSTAVEAYQIEVETAALVRAAEDILSLTRSLKEMWLFGQLNTVGKTGAEGQIEEDVRAVGEVLGRLQAAREGGRGGKEML